MKKTLSNNPKANGKANNLQPNTTTNKPLVTHTLEYSVIEDMKKTKPTFLCMISSHSHNNHGLLLDTFNDDKSQKKGIVVIDNTSKTAEANKIHIVEIKLLSMQQV
jgi:hypothetical protein